LWTAKVEDFWGFEKVKVKEVEMAFNPTIIGMGFTTGYFIVQVIITPSWCK
jgi:hypothetical protein